MMIERRTDTMPDSMTMPPQREDRIAYLLGPERCDGWQPLVTAVPDPLISADEQERHANFSRFTRSWLDKPFVFRCGASAPSRRFASKGGSYAYLRSFVLDLNNFCRMAQLTLGAGVTVQLGDDDLHVPPHRAPGGRVYAKARVISTRCGSLLPLSTNRLWPIHAHPDGSFANVSNQIQHPFGRFGATSRQSEIRFTPLVPWSQKRGAFVWRGATTGFWHGGQHLRRHFVHSMSSSHDVRFVRSMSNHTGKLKLPCAANEFVCHPNHTGNAMNQLQILKYKYALSLEGNDCATNLKWLMAQNSVVVMPQPRIETWLMEGLLRPWVHYVPLDDPTRADALLDWLEAHEADCLRIVRNANAWIQAVISDLFGLVAPVMQVGAVRSTWPTLSQGR